MKKFLSIIFVCLFFIACSSRTDIKEFREKLYVPKGSFMDGYSAEELNKAPSVDDVVKIYGKPTKSEEGNVTVLFSTFKMKGLEYPGKDEFGNPCIVKLGFYYRCTAGHESDLNCYKLVGINTVKE